MARNMGIQVLISRKVLSETRGRVKDFMMVKLGKGKCILGLRLYEFNRYTRCLFLLFGVLSTQESTFV